MTSMDAFRAAAREAIDWHLGRRLSASLWARALLRELHTARPGDRLPALPRQVDEVFWVRFVAMAIARVPDAEYRASLSYIFDRRVERDTMRCGSAYHAARRAAWFVLGVVKRELSYFEGVPTNGNQKSE